MDVSQIIGLVLACTSLIALIVLLYLILIPMSRVEKEERVIRTKLYKAITEYLKIKIDSACVLYALSQKSQNTPIYILVY